MTQTLTEVTIYTDGGCDPNPGPGGWGAVLISGDHKKELSGGADDTTNNRMELQAAISALAALKRACSVNLFTDSQYMRKGITEWVHKWKLNGWMTASKKPVQNVDLWQALTKEVARHEVEWHWVKGHAGNEYNELVHNLASAAIPRPEKQDVNADAYIYTSVSCLKNGGRGAWITFIKTATGTQELSGVEDVSTANQLHIQAVNAGLAAVDPTLSLHITTTSDYIVQGATQWIGGWQGRGWRNGSGDPIKNQTHWQEYAQLRLGRQVSWEVIKEKKKDKLPEEMKPLKPQLKHILDAHND